MLTFIVFGILVVSAINIVLMRSMSSAHLIMLDVLVIVFFAVVGAIK